MAEAMTHRAGGYLLDNQASMSSDFLPHRVPNATLSHGRTASSGWYDDLEEVAEAVLLAVFGGALHSALCAATNRPAQPRGRARGGSTSAY